MHLHFDCFSGISGDMTLGALIELGADPEQIRTGLRALPLDGATVAFPRRDAGHGMVGTTVAVTLEAPSSDGTANHHRHYSDIAEMIAAASLPGSAEARAQAIFRRLAEAEAKVHGVELGQVHFHEVGASDSIVDVVGVALALDLLDVETLSSTPLPLGRGFTDSSHGRIPIPAPATLECLIDAPCYASGLDVELVTPTGAAIIGALVTEFTSFPGMTVRRVGYGAGTRRHADRPNILRAVLGSPVLEPVWTGETVWEVAANLDDQTPEDIAHAARGLWAAGALDVWTAPIVMKKGRSGHTLVALVPPTQRAAVVEAMLRHTTTLGVRLNRLERATVERERLTIETEFGMVTVKIGRGPDGSVWNLAPEDDDVARRASERGVPTKHVRMAALAAAWSRFGGASRPDE